MERLLADAQELTGVKYDINNLSDVYNAIHAIQGKLGVTGTTALEAATTLSGSFNMMKASFTDVLGSLAIGENVKESFANLAESVGTFVFDNLIPMLGNIFNSLPEGIMSFAETAGPLLMEQGKKLVDSLGQGFSNNQALSKAFENIKASGQGLITSLQTAFSQVPTFFQGIVTSLAPIGQAIMTTIGQLDFSGIQNLITAILPAVQAGFQTFISIITPALTGLMDAFSNLWNACQPLISGIASALLPAFQVLGSFLGGVAKGAIMGVTGVFNVLAGVIRALTPVFNLLLAAFKKISPILAAVAQAIGTAIGLFGNFGTSATSLKSLMSSAWTNIKSVISTAKTAITTSITGIKTVFTSLKTSGTTLKSALTTIWNAIKSLISSAAGAIKGFISNIVSTFNKLKSSGNTLKSGLTTAWNGIKSVISGAVSAISGHINRIKSMFNSLKNINLLDAGRAIMNGFLRGILAVWNTIKSKVSSMTGWIRAHKGPISYDRKLLIPAGKAIMGGLNKGLMDSFENVKTTTLSVAGFMEDTFSNPLSKDLSYNLRTSSFVGKDSFVKAKENKQPIQLNLNLGGQNFKAFVDAISLEQDKVIDLKLAY